MPPADPAIVDTVVTASVIGEVEIKSEAVPVQRNRTVQVRDLEHDGDESTTFRHGNHSVVRVKNGALPTRCRYLESVFACGP